MIQTMEELKRQRVCVWELGDLHSRKLLPPGHKEEGVPRELGPWKEGKSRGS